MDLTDNSGACTNQTMGIKWEQQITWSLNGLQLLSDLELCQQGTDIPDFAIDFLHLPLSNFVHRLDLFGSTLARSLVPVGLTARPWRRSWVARSTGGCCVQRGSQVACRCRSPWLKVGPWMDTSGDTVDTQHALNPYDPYSFWWDTSENLKVSILSENRHITACVCLPSKFTSDWWVNLFSWVSFLVMTVESQTLMSSRSY